jgi:hypothetical protein
VGRDSGKEEVIQLLVALVFSINHHYLFLKNEQVYNSVPSTGGDIRDILEILCELEVGRMHARAGLEILVSPVVFCLSTMVPSTFPVTYITLLVLFCQQNTRQNSKTA